ncbi:MAG TPA: 4-hydroxybenzoate octaprenyltransferase [Candidatus Latescibacteria bacterium]|jgi:4-hydroxybenzoate polyprenyltransferase|nr:4-hydroxybenzoate octaprenyltransferase [Candidatus Latescibacterota bacterium]
MNRLSPVLLYGRMIKFSHSIFALPFALSGAALAAATHGIRPVQVAWIVVAMVAARSAAMGFNRLVDRRIDADNPRTAQRELPTGAMSVLAVILFVLLSAVALVGAAWQLNRLCLLLSPVALAVVFAYSYTKRFTWASHLVLGLALALAPLGAWIAVTGRFDLPPILLGLSVMSWVAGFDILYSCQDHDFDRKAGLYSIPVRFGLVGALRLARVMHLLAVLFMVALGFSAGLQAVYFIGVAAITSLLVYEHRLVSPQDLTKVNTAFMTMNSLVSVAFFIFILADILWLG